MDKAELLESLRALTEAVEKSCNDGAQDAGDIVRGILDNTDISCTYETVRKIVSAIIYYSDSTKMSFAKCLNEDGWIKAGDVMSCKTVASVVANMELDSQKEKAIGSLIDALADESAATNSALACALEKQGYIEKESCSFEEAAQEWAEQHDYFKEGSEEFEDAAHEWADDNGLYDIKDFSFEDLADKYESSEVRDFVAAYIEEHL